MNGNRYLLDTNAIIALLKGDSSLTKLLQDTHWLGISIISQIEFLAFSGLTEGASHFGRKTEEAKKLAR